MKKYKLLRPTPIHDTGEIVYVEYDDKYRDSVKVVSVKNPFNSWWIVNRNDTFINRLQEIKPEININITIL